MNPDKEKSPIADSNELRRETEYHQSSPAQRLRLWQTTTMQRESKTSGSTSTTSNPRSSIYATAYAGSAPCLPQPCIILAPMQCSDAHLERHQPGLPSMLLHPQRAAHLSQHPLLLAATEADLSRTCHGLAGLSPQAVPRITWWRLVLLLCVLM